jgi:GNAT superfamily N-acetyltransferase
LWLAEAAVEHGGFLQARVVVPLPAPATRPRPVLLVETFFVRPANRGIGVGEQLLRAALAWARDGGFGQVRVGPGPPTTAMVERVGFTADERAYRLELP